MITSKYENQNYTYNLGIYNYLQMKNTTGNCRNFNSFNNCIRAIEA